MGPGTRSSPSWAAEMHVTYTIIHIIIGYIYVERSTEGGRGGGREKERGREGGDNRKMESNGGKEGGREKWQTRAGERREKKRGRISISP